MTLLNIQALSSSIVPQQQHHPRDSGHNPQDAPRKASLADTPSTAESVKKGLDITQKIERKLAEYNASQNVFKRWLFEGLSWAVSALSMAAIVVIYLYLRDKPISKVGNLLTYANVLGKISSAALIVPTTEALGQLKWNWFHKSNAMWDFEIFDKASRGPLGAIMLLFRTRGRSLAALGALLILLLLAIDTFFQQVIEMPERLVLQASSSIPRIVAYKPEYLAEYTKGYEAQQSDSSLRADVRAFLYGNGTQPVPFGNGTRPEIPLTCPTSTCTWPTYETLGICSQCVDASDILKFDCLYGPVDWTSDQPGRISPDLNQNATVCGYWFSPGNNGSVLMSGYILNETRPQSRGEALLVRTFPFTEMFTKREVPGGSVNFKHIRDPLLDALIVSSPDTESVYKSVPPVAQQCVLSWCVKTIESAYESGIYSETVISRYQNETEGPFPWESFNASTPYEEAFYISFMENVTINRAAVSQHDSKSVVFNESYRVDNTSAANVMVIFDDFFPSYYTDNGVSGKPQLRYRNFPPGAYFSTLR